MRRIYTIEALLHLGNPTPEQQAILNRMLENGQKKVFIKPKKK